MVLHTIIDNYHIAGFIKTKIVIDFTNQYQF